MNSLRKTRNLRQTPEIYGKPPEIPKPLKLKLDLQSRGPLNSKALKPRGPRKQGLSVDFRGFSVDFVFTVGSSQLSVELWVLCFEGWAELLDLRVFQGITEPKAFP